MAYQATYLKNLLGNGQASNLSQQMLQQGQEQTATAMQGKNALMNQMEQQAQATQNQAMQAAQQNQNQGSGLGSLLKIAGLIYGLGGAGAAAAEGAEVGTALADMSWKNLGNSGAFNWF